MEKLKPKYVILARHGTYDDTTGELDENGRIKAIMMAQRLERDYLKGLKIELFYSPKTRAEQTAEAYSQVLNIPKSELIKEYLIRETEENSIRINEATQVIEKALYSRKAEAYIFITHEDTAIDSAILFRRKNFNLETEIETLGFAWAILLDLENPKKLIKLSP